MPHVVVLGAGYAGAHATPRARAEGADVTIVDPDGHHAFTTRFAAVAAGRAPLGDLAAPIDGLLDVAVVADLAVAVDPEWRTVALAGGTTLHFDALVVTTGAEADTPAIAGLADHALALASVQDTLAIREVVRELAALTGGAGDGEGDTDGERRPRPLVVIGGGATGVELAAEIAHHRPDLPVRLVERAARLLPTETRALRRGARRILRAAGVEVLLGRTVERVDADGVVLDGDERLDGVAVWAGGWRARGSTLLPAAPTEEGRLRVGPDLAVRGLAGVFAAGDTAAHHDPLGGLLPMSAQIAARAGEVAGHNAVAWAAGRHHRRALLLELGRVLDLGGGVGVARVGPVHLARRPLDRLVPVLHLAIDLHDLWRIGGVTGVLRHAPGRAQATVRPGRVRHLRAVG
jgi:NADH:ubiquinone reductase (H+-translocating)